MEVLVKFNNRYVNRKQVDWLNEKLPKILAPMLDVPNDPDARVFETDIRPEIKDGHPTESHAFVEIRILANHNETRKQRAGHIIFALRHGIRLLAEAEGHEKSAHLSEDRRLHMNLAFTDAIAA